MFYEIHVPAYTAHTGEQRAANTFHVAEEANADRHIAQIENKGGKPARIEMTPAEYKTAVKAKMLA